LLVKHKYQGLILLQQESNGKTVHKQMIITIEEAKYSELDEVPGRN